MNRLRRFWPHRGFGDHARETAAARHLPQKASKQTRSGSLLKRVAAVSSFLCSRNIYIWPNPAIACQAKTGHGGGSALSRWRFAKTLVIEHR
jgi:hypothetical protein